MQLIKPSLDRCDMDSGAIHGKGANRTPPNTRVRCTVLSDTRVAQVNVCFHITLLNS